MLLPLNVTAAGDPPALLTNKTLPAAVPADCGANTTLMETFCPDVSVAGSDSPLRLNALPVTFACVIVKFELPELVICSACELLVPVVIFAKVTLFCDNDKPACAPVPVTPIGVVPPELTIEIVPLVVAVVVGLNCTVNVALCEAANVNGVLTPLAVRPCPLTPICERVVALLPVFVMVIV